MIFYATGYCNEAVFYPQYQCEVKFPPFFAFQASVYKQTNTDQHLSIPTRMEPNFFTPDLFSYLRSVLKYIVIVHRCPSMLYIIHL